MKIKKWVKLVILGIIVETCLFGIVLVGGAIGIISTLGIGITLLKGVDWVYEK